MIVHVQADELAEYRKSSTATTIIKCKFIQKDKNFSRKTPGIKRV